MTVPELRAAYVERIRRAGAPLTDELAAAFGSVPREAFVPGGFRRRDGARVEPGDPGFLAAVYTDDVLVTKVEDGVPVSSSSQPSLMALMLAALDLAPGLRVLEIGAGTGYNAALMAAMGAQVTTVDVQADVADRARSALAAAGVDGVRVEHGDGYVGPAGSRFDRVIVTVGVAGISPQWLARVEEGPVVVPVEHAGTHPVLTVHGAAEGPVTATVLCPAGFMSAAGPLTAGHPYAHPAPAVAGELGEMTVVSGPRWEQPLDPVTYRDLWYAAGVWYRRATHAAVPGHEHSLLTLLDESRTGGAAIQPDGTVLAGGAEAEHYAHDAAEAIRRWEGAGRPPMQSWRVTLAMAGQPEAPIWVPANWQL